MTFKQQMEETRESVSQIACWCLTVALHQEFGVGAQRLERLAKLKREERKNYEQINREAHEDGLEVAMEHLKRCAEAALRQECQVVEKDPGDWERYKEQLRTTERLAVRAKLSSMRAARNPCPKADAEKERIFRRAMEETLSPRRV